MRRCERSPKCNRALNILERPFFLHGLAYAPAFEGQGCGSAALVGGLEEIRLKITDPERSGGVGWWVKRRGQAGTGALGDETQKPCSWF